MYRAYINNSLFYDPNVEELAIINPVVDLEDNTSGSFKFMISPKHPNYGMFTQDPRIEIEVYEDDKKEPTFSGRVIREKDSFNLIKAVTCEGELAYLLDSNQPQAEYHDLTVRQYLETVVGIHNAKVEKKKQFTVGMVTVKDPNDKLFKYTNFETTLNVIKTDLIDTYGGHLRIRHENGVRYIDYLADYVRDSTQIIEFGKNLLDFARDYDLSDIYTACIPLGAKLEEPGDIKALEHYVTVESVNNGSQIVKNDEAVKNFGYIEKIIKYENVGTPTNLLKKATDWLSNKQFADMMLQLKAIDLSTLGIESDDIQLLDKVKVVSPVHGLNKFFPITKMTINLDKPSQNTFTFGEKSKSTLTSQNNDVIGGLQEEIKKIPNQVIQSAVDNASQLIQNALNGHIVMKPDELLIMDTDNIDTATKVWRWNLNGLGYSGNGYNGTYSTAITMDGQIVGDHIVAGTISAEKLDVNYRAEVNNGIENAKNEAISATQVQIKTSADGIMQTVSKTYETVEGSEQKKNDAILAGQTAADQAEANANINLNNYKTEIGTYLRHDVDGVELGEVSGKNKQRLTPNGQEFISNNVVTGYTRDGEFHYFRGVVDERMRIGGYVFKKDPVTGGMSLEWEEEIPVSEVAAL